MKKKGTKEYWSMTEGVFNCLIDKKRTLAFKKAIYNTVKKGDVVVDVGTGSGILAMFAADAGAKRVYAVECDENNLKTLKENFKINGFENKIILVNGDARKVRLPEKMDVIIGEMIATGLIEELQVPVMNNILKFANKKVRVLLHYYEGYVDLVFNRSLFYGNKFNIFRYEYSDIKDTRSKSYTEKIRYMKVDFSKMIKMKKINKKLKVTINKTGVINGIRISSRTIFSNKDVFFDSFAYSYPIVLPIKDTRVKKGDSFIIFLTYYLCEGFKNLKYSITKNNI